MIPTRFAVIAINTMIVDNCVMAHPDYTLNDSDFILITSETAGPGDVYDEVEGTFTRPEPEPEPLPTDQEPYRAAIDAFVEETAKEKQYGGTVAIATYVNSTIPQWKAEAETFIAWRDATWLYAITELNKVTNGERPQPTVAEFVAELEPITWPA